MTGDLFGIAPQDLAPARVLAHEACQWPSRAARANLTALPDDSHSNLGWSPHHRALVSRDLGDGNQIGFGFDTASLLWLEDGAAQDELTFSGASSVEEISAWVDAKLGAAGLLTAANVETPYTLDDGYSFADELPAAALVTLGNWYAAAASALETLVDETRASLPGSPQVRCWPHHFDIAALCMLEEGDPETARSIGVGMSPGDGAFAEPYFYTSPWPPPPAARLAPATSPLRWNTDGFVSLVAVAGDLRGVDDLAGLLRGAFASARASL